ncbi:MAG: thioether cross-link-forming SCIFF peptide maturase [Clostridiales bacterium GWF2_38_85]|nr:MAG: thioether cross-link-forming SCIFF peptide maturase [Clostridiales bacterium GWF2_38_85]HBL83753.1 thioether cross-link-forming SCIFF peptide maturase [Clostridiales bacterium]
MLHTFEIGGEYLALDVNSGALHSFYKLAYDICKLLTPPLTKETPEILYNLEYDKNEVKLAYSELYSLYEQKLLFSPDFIVDLPKNSVIPIKALCLHVAHDCNMRCGYCFADAGEYCGKREIMAPEVGMKAIDFLIEHSAKIENLEVDFFGGEPLMAMDTVKAVTEYGKKRAAEAGKHINFTLTTNGALLDDETIEYLDREMFNLVLSVDGRKSVNDFMRRFPEGGSTYDKIMPQFKKLAEMRQQNGKSYYVRGTFTAKNLDFSSDVFHLADCGFEEISVEPVALENNHPLAIKEEMLPRIYKEYEKLAIELAKRKSSGDKINFFHFNVDLEAGPCVYKRVKGCGAGCEYLAVTPPGALFPCHQFAGMDNYKLGNIYDGFNDESAQLRKKFKSTNIYTKPECQNCFAKFFCGGGCVAASVKYEGGDMSKCYHIGCELERKRLECALYLQAKLAE